MIFVCDKCFKSMSERIYNGYFYCSDSMYDGDCYMTSFVELYYVKHNGDTLRSF